MSSDLTAGGVDLEALHERTLPRALDLLVPWELADNYDLPAAQRQPIDDALTTLQQMLELDDSDPRHDPRQLDAVIAALPLPDTQPHEPIETHSSLSTREVTEYDRYFLTNHVDSNDPALSLVRSLLMCCQVFLTLCACHTALDAEQVAMQRRGFLAYISLLRRLFNPGEAR
jgi:hypothetical protein